MKYKKTLCISIVAYKNYQYIVRLINLINKYCKNIDKIIVIVDNTPRSCLDQKLIGEIKKLDNVWYKKTVENVGFAKANNLAFSLVSSKYFAIINPDIIINEDSFTKICNFMETNSSVGAVIPRLINNRGETLPVYRRNVTLLDIIARNINPFGIFNKRVAYHNMQDKNYDSLFPVPFGQGSFLVIRSSLFKQIGGFDQRYFMYMEDADLCRKINYYSRLVYFPNTTVIHIWSRGSHKNIRLLFYHVISMIKYFNKWGIK